MTKKRKSSGAMFHNILEIYVLHELSGETKINVYYSSCDQISDLDFLQRKELD